jgi:hypothetical protein
MLFEHGGIVAGSTGVIVDIIVVRDMVAEDKFVA